MKIKIIAIICILLVSVCLGGCKKEIDVVSQKMMDDISALGEVTIEDEPQIAKLETLYATLTEEQKGQVSNYIDLINARDLVDKLQAAETAKDDEFELISRLYYQLVEDGVKTIKAIFKDPTKVTFHEIYVVSKDGLFDNVEDLNEAFYDERYADSQRAYEKQRVHLYYTYSHAAYGKQTGAYVHAGQREDLNGDIGMMVGLDEYVEFPFPNPKKVIAGNETNFVESSVPGVWVNDEGLTYFMINLEDYEAAGYKR